MSEIALFPLSNPLFPEQKMTLQIFEPRYVSLVSRCMKNDEGFGVVQIREGREVGRAPQVFQFGVEARIVDWEQLENGLLGITIQGCRKFTLSSTRVEADQLMMAEVNWLPEEPCEPIPDHYDGLLDLAAQLRQHPVVSQLNLPEIRNSRDLGWQLCQLLPLSSPDKVALLSLSDPGLRLEHLAERVSRLSSGDDEQEC
ncbi:LON peptidase substrate-binding domain-containing protein [Aestuariicella sp. G3-2]|uniref:LON peptidase substrate-binding domain-containing protein n=1 Tax=Pseudomaricurvus albidus TaxID=2842452 RepID=UPI001C0AF555|nr:LON peptidase substrate-binding domain-containing protein [Aestuariicella albida]MBU3070697.1 LON peptidase substrate-binding domain-containing protein [Aestuariicella albida]